MILRTAPVVDHLILQPDGKFILSNGDQDIYGDITGKNVISRYLPDGTIDAFFANRGSIKKDGHNVAGIVLQKDYKIVTLENILTESNPDTAYFYLYRYKNDVDTINTLSTPENAIAKINSSIKVSPNPVQSILHITGLKSNTKLSIINGLGKTVAEANASSNSYNWNIQNLSAGNYFLVASQNNKLIASIKFIKQ